MMRSLLFIFVMSMEYELVDKCTILMEYHFVVVPIMMFRETSPQLSKAEQNPFVWTEIEGLLVMLYSSPGQDHELGYVHS